MTAVADMAHARHRRDPCLQESRFIGEAIESVISQTRPVDDVLVVLGSGVVDGLDARDIERPRWLLGLWDWLPRQQG